MPTEKQKKAIDTYTSLMEEAKVRLAAISHALGGNTKVPQRVSAEKICEKLESLHPEFYPRPVQQVPVAPPRPFGIEAVESGFLTKAELPKLVGRCGNTLHRGTAKTLLEFEPMPRGEIATWQSKIHTLLDIHWFTLVSGEPHYLCAMNGGKDGRVGVEIIPSSSAPPQ